MINFVGEQFGDYRLTEYLGGGGFADVYLGEHIYLSTADHPVKAAIKVLKGEFSVKEIAELRNEAQTIARLKHPHIVQVITFSVTKINTRDIPFLVMDYAPGASLDKRHPRGTILPLSTIVFYMKQIAEALQYAHEQKVIHRDVKPANFLLGKGGEILLSDFGLAVIAHRTLSWEAQKVAGTWSYAAPEHYNAKTQPASDQYSLGVIVYEWLCGVPPFNGDFLQLGYQHTYVPPPPLHEKIPTISPAIEEVVLKALAKDPKDRFENVQTFATALEQASQIASTQAYSQDAPSSVTVPPSEMTRSPSASAPFSNHGFAPLPIGSSSHQSPSHSASPPFSGPMANTNLRRLSRNKVGILIGLVFILIAGSAGLLYMPLTHWITSATMRPTGTARNHSTYTTPAQATSSSTPISWPTYTGDGYTLNYPPGWKTTKSESTGTVTFADPAGIYNLSIAVTSNPDGAASPDDLADAAATGARSKLKNPKDETIAPTTTVGGETWSQRAVSGDSTVNGQTANVKLVIIADNHPASSPSTRGFIIAYGTARALFDVANSTHFQPMLQSFKFTS